MKSKRKTNVHFKIDTRHFPNKRDVTDVSDIPNKRDARCVMDDRVLKNFHVSHIKMMFSFTLIHPISF